MHTPLPTQPRYLNPSNLMAGMLLISTFLLGLATGTLAASAMIGLFILVHLATSWPRMPKLRTFYALLWAVPYALWWRYGTGEGAVGTRNSSFTMLSFMGYYTLTLGTHQLLSRDRAQLDYALACAVMALGLAGVGRFNVFFLPLTVLFGAMMLAFLRMEQVHRNGMNLGMRTWRYVAAVVVMLGVSGAIEVFFVPAVPHAGTWLITHLVPSSPIRGAGGFSRNAKIGNMPGLWGQGEQGREPMLYVFSDRVSPYLRGTVYNEYKHGAGMEAGEWSVAKSPDKEQPLERPLETREAHLGRNIFNSKEGTDSQEIIGVVYPAFRVADSYFLPLGVHQVGSFADKSLVGLGDSMRPDGFGAAGGYAYYSPMVKGQPRPLPADLELDPLLEPAISALARQATRDSKNPFQQIAMVEGWFRDNFEYKIGFTRLNEDKDPVLEFLQDQRAAHCEYFASACVLMLRSLGIPARYVTGFIVEERGATESLWIARRRHAHAWVEAFLENEGWVTVEPTPPSGMPAVERGSPWDQRMDWLSAQWERLKQLVLTGGIFGVMLDTVVTLPQKAPLWAWFTLLAAGLTWMFRKNIWAWLRPSRQEPCDPRIASLRQNLAETERLLNRHGLTRPPAMTIHVFLSSVRESVSLPQTVREQACAALEQFANERYRPYVS